MLLEHVQKLSQNEAQYFPLPHRHPSQSETLSTLKCPPAFSVHSASKQMLSIFCQSVNIQSSWVWLLNAIMLPAGSSLNHQQKLYGRLFGPFGCHPGSAGSSTRSKFGLTKLQIPEHANIRTIPSWLFDACLSARDRLTSSRPDAILVTLLPIKKSNRQPLLICTKCHTQDTPAEMNAEFMSSMSTWGPLSPGGTPRWD